LIFILELFELDVDGFTEIIPFTSSCGNLVDSSKGKPQTNKKFVHFSGSTFLAPYLYHFSGGVQNLH
jgi:hypothetical protein